MNKPIVLQHNVGHEKIKIAVLICSLHCHKKLVCSLQIHSFTYSFESLCGIYYEIPEKEQNVIPSFTAIVSMFIP